MGLNTIKILIESKWNLNFVTQRLMYFEVIILIESKWNLNV